MNEFLEQFLIEARELVTQATDDLLALETRPEDQDQLDSAFRAFHTLKGAAGIIEFPPMVRALHAAEDLLSRARSGDIRLDPARIGDCLTALDQVDQWLSSIESEGEPPPSSLAEAQADAIVALFVAAAPAAPPIVQPGAASDPHWVDHVLAGRGPESLGAALAIRHRPDADCFFHGVDPLAMFAGLPGLIGLHARPTQPWPPIAVMDPFSCQVEITALSTAPRAAVSVALAGARGELEIIEAPGDTLPAEAREILQAQLVLLDIAGDDGLLGRSRSVARVAANVLRRLGRTREADQFDQTALSAPSDGAALAAALQGLVAAPAGDGAASSQQALKSEAATRSLRVDVDRIDALVRLTGELSVIKNALGHLAGVADAGVDAVVLATSLRDQHALLGRLVDDLQHSVLSIRVLPMRHVFQRFPRLVRDLSANLGKSARLVLEGETTEADKAIVEDLFEPLLHVIRNALDHGVETAEVRKAQGKDPQGVLQLRAARQGEHVLIEIEDDGGGIDVEAVRKTALQRGMLSAEAANVMTAAQIIDLVFAPGFSTAQSLSEVSGRGVGMDAVRASIAQMGGRVELENRPGEGTLVRFVLPFTIMMTSVMTLEAGGQVFGVALDKVLETVKISRDDVSMIGEASAFTHRGQVIPLVDLVAALGAGAGRSSALAPTIVIANVAGQRVGLEVDRLGGRIDVMLKPLEGLLAGMVGVSGTTLLGDGRVMILLDLPELLS